jgi:G3E family GTPase
METVVVLVAGLVDHDVAARVWFDRPGAVLVRHDLSRVEEGVVRRWVDGVETELQLEHGCVSCTMRLDLLPLLHSLNGTVVVHLDPLLEPAVVRRALEENGVRVECVITVLDAVSWLDDALSDASMVSDQRTVAQVVVAQAEAADVLVLQGSADDRTLAVLDRLAPGAHRCTPETLVVRRGKRRLMPLVPSDGVSTAVFTADRPFHPVRLNDALDVLLDGTVVRARGRLWVADAPEVAMRLESAGCGLHVGEGGPWTGTPDQQLVAITLGSPDSLVAVFQEALLTDDEVAFVESIKEVS